MTNDRDLIARLRAHDERLAATPARLALALRVQRSLQRGRPAPWPRWRLGLAGALPLTALAVFLLLRTEAVAPTFDGAIVRPLTLSACSVRETDGGRSYGGHCRVDVRGVSVESKPNASFSEAGAGWRVSRGHCRFVVTPRSPGTPPLEVHVSGGVIEVTGTEFVVEQQDDRGSVELFEGTIRFVAPGRVPIEMHPGERFSWSPLHAENTPALQASVASEAVPPEPSPTAPPRAAASSVSRSSASSAANGSPLEVNPTEEVRDGVRRDVDRVQRLRALGRYGEALDALSEVDESSLDRGAHEVLSYERGTLLERSGALEAACAHWGEHAERYPSGSYAELARRRLERCRARRDGEGAPTKQ